MYNIFGDPHRYDALLCLPHPTSPIHPPMARQNRAAQFAPFDALSGHSAAIAEAARQTVPQWEPDENEKQVLNRTLLWLQANRTRQPEVTVTYFCPDTKKEGGAYRQLHGRFRTVDSFRRCICLTDGQLIPLDRICELFCDADIDFM